MTICDNCGEHDNCDEYDEYDEYDDDDDDQFDGDQLDDVVWFSKLLRCNPNVKNMFQHRSNINNIQNRSLYF